MRTSAVVRAQVYEPAKGSICLAGSQLYQAGIVPVIQTPEQVTVSPYQCNHGHYEEPTVAGFNLLKLSFSGYSDASRNMKLTINHAAGY